MDLEATYMHVHILTSYGCMLCIMPSGMRMQIRKHVMMNL